MRYLWYFLIIAGLLWNCTGSKKALKIERENPQTENDSVEYKLLTFDAKFDAWYTMYKSPALYRSQEYYENWNRQYVAEWNYKAAISPTNSFFETIFGYEPNVDYGFELNHELFYYFMYVENVLHIPILPNGPKATPY